MRFGLFSDSLSERPNGVIGQFHPNEKGEREDDSVDLIGGDPLRFRAEKSRRKVHTLSQSCTRRIGSTIAAALTGEATSDNIGAPSVPRPENPPFERPNRITAGIATR